MKVKKEINKHFLDDNWRTYTCGCMCWHSENVDIYNKELYLPKFAFNLP